MTIINTNIATTPINATNPAGIRSGKIEFRLKTPRGWNLEAEGKP
jgi:hypothetical protein